MMALEKSIDTESLNNPNDTQMDPTGKAVSVPATNEPPSSEFPSIPGAPKQEIGLEDLTRGMQEQNDVATPLASDAAQGKTVKDYDKPPLRRASIAASLGSTFMPDTATPYPEEKGVRDAVDNASIANGKLKQLGQMSAEERAHTGAYYGGGIGQKFGKHGAIMGAAMGAVATRAAGMVQSGEHEDNQRKTKVNDTLRMMKIVNDYGDIDFEDGGVFQVNSAKPLANTSPMGGKPTRNMYEVDKTNPFTNRATAVAKPLAYHLTKGILGYKDPKNARDAKALANTTAMLVNAMQSGAEDISTIYRRGQQLAKKFGVTQKGMESFMSSIAKEIPDEDANHLKQGIQILFAPERYKK